LKSWKSIEKSRTIETANLDLHTIKKLTSDKILDYDLPTLCKRDNIKSNVLINKISNFKKNLFESYPVLKNIDMTNLCIAGGSISSIVRNTRRTHYENSDIDFFVYGLDEEEAKRRVVAWIHDIINSEHIKDYKLIRNDFTVSILLNIN
jgi:hypothetical protein